MRKFTSAIVAALTAAAIVATSPATGPIATAQLDERPNILIILTDDQRADEQSMAVMPKTRRIFGEKGTRFENAVTTTSLCCPSRASIFSGKYMHNHGIRSNRDGASFDAVDTIQHELGEAGYLRGFAGKYMNFYEQDPPFWDRWAQQIALQDEGYSDTPFNVDGKRVIADYGTTFIGDKTIDFMEAFERNDDTPWLLFVAPYAPHKPAHPQPKYASAKLPRWRKTPAFYERGKELSDKPEVIRKQDTSLDDVKRIRKNQLRSLMSVDDIVGRIFKTMDSLGEDNTLAIFMSDNGFLWYEHELEGKRHPYSESIRIPLYMRWPGHVNSGSSPNRIVANIDIAPTVYEAAGVQPSYVVDGRSLLQTMQRDRILIEYQKDDVGTHARSYSGLWSPFSKYTEYENGFREYYATQDRHELENLFHNGNPNDDPDSAPQLSAILEVYRTCVGATCP
jgi:arylsulfatase A-like enzyme